MCFRIPLLNAHVYLGSTGVWPPGFPRLWGVSWRRGWFGLMIFDRSEG